METEKPDTPRNNIAIISVALAIVGVFGIVLSSILAVIVGIFALQKAKETGQGLALAWVSIGLGALYFLVYMAKSIGY